MSTFLDQLRRPFRTETKLSDTLSAPPADLAGKTGQAKVGFSPWDEALAAARRGTALDPALSQDKPDMLTFGTAQPALEEQRKGHGCQESSGMACLQGGSVSGWSGRPQHPFGDCSPPLEEEAANIPALYLEPRPIIKPYVEAGPFEIEEGVLNRCWDKVKDFSSFELLLQDQLAPGHPVNWRQVARFLFKKAHVESASNNNHRRTSKKDAPVDRLRLDGKVALVTGGGHAIGRSFAHAFGEAGAKVMVVGHDLATADQVVAELLAKGVESSAYCADVTSERDIKGMVEATAWRFGGLHVAVNIAGAREDVSSPGADLGVHTRGVLMCCQEEARHMSRAGGGAIINVASMASLPKSQTQQAAVVKLSRTLALDWARKKVRVNCISPGMVGGNAGLAENFIENIPLGRLCRVEDLQAAAVYLASDASEFITGNNLAIDGGQSLW